jgi:ATP-dependent DNA helicase RecQ
MRECGACDNCLRAGRPPRRGRRRRVRGGGPGHVRHAPRPSRTARRTDLLDRLRELRGELARRHEMPPLLVFSEDVLKALAAHAPTTPEEVLRLPGVTAALLDRWGAPLMDVLSAFSTENGGRRVGRRAPAEPAPSRAAPPGPAADRGGGGPVRAPEAAALQARQGGEPAFVLHLPRQDAHRARPPPPGDDAEMLEVPGVGPAKLEKYGEAFLEVLREG